MRGKIGVMGGVHAIIGAAVGSFFNKKSSAFLGGLVSHLVADALPHKDSKPAIEVSILLASLVAIAKWRGIDSPEFWGALGGVIPDAEHGLAMCGIIDQEKKIFPTHLNNGILHGTETDERWSQLLAGIASTVIVALNSNEPAQTASDLLPDPIRLPIPETCEGDLSPHHL